ncbi:DMT family transporter [Ruegeria sp. SCPT10]|uniref:DMT family transporter n=1 Tax=Ruegeria sp. SCP10 TaxID=3141377 RepID=UPI00333B0767
MFELDERQKSIALMVLCPISLALMGYAVKMSNQSPVALVLLARFSISALVYTAWLGIRGFNFREIRPSRHVLRTALGFSSVACLFASISLIPLSTALCLSYTVPIFSYVISVCIGHIKADFRFLYVVGAVAAIAMIVQPSADVSLFGALLGLASAFFGALALFEIKRISSTEGSDAILLMYFLYSTLALLLFSFVATDTNGLQHSIAVSAPALIGVGLFGLLYQFSLVGSLKLVSVATVSLALLAAVALGYGIDIIAIGAQVSPWAMLGTALLAACIGAYSQASQS